MEIKDIQAAMEAILFASGEPLSAERICAILDLDKATVEKVARNLADQYGFERRGIRLLNLDGAYQLCSAPEYAGYVRKTLETRKPAKLSQSALEVLAVVAYFQPTTRAYVDQLRGVDNTYTVGMLVERGLIEECGRMPVPGRPILYRTTKEFLRAFGLANVEELPQIDDLAGGIEGQISLMGSTMLSKDGGQPQEQDDEAGGQAVNM